jgi:hypothetical protein
MVKGHQGNSGRGATVEKHNYKAGISGYCDFMKDGQVCRAAKHMPIHISAEAKKSTWKRRSKPTVAKDRN